MELVHVHAMAKPGSREHLLVKVLDQSGNDLSVSSQFLKVKLYAADDAPPLVEDYPTVSIDSVDSIGGEWWDITLGTVTYQGIHGPDETSVGEIAATMYAVDYGVPERMGGPVFRRGAAIVRV